MSLIITNGRIVTHNTDYIADIYIEDGRIKTIFDKISSSADRIIDAKGKYVIPGGIDVHTHLDMPFGNTVSSDDFKTGTIAAAFGGTTSIIDFPAQEPGQQVGQALDRWLGKAESKACIDYGFHMIITDTTQLTTDDLKNLVDQGITSFKLFMAYPKSLMLGNADIFRLMQSAKALGAFVSVHAENGEVIEEIISAAVKEGKSAPIFHALTRPAVLEGEAIQRAIALSQVAGCSLYIVHLSTVDGLHQIKQARNQGLSVYTETCPQYLLLSIEDMVEATGFESAKYVCTPPLREKHHQKKLWQAIADGYIQVIATDHCPFNFQGQKDLGKDSFTKIPNGVPGIENRLGLIYEEGVQKGRINLHKWIDLCCTAPAKLFGLFPTKGTIKEGSDADIVIWDPEKKHTISAATHHMNVDYNLYEGYKLSGWPEMVISRGEIIIENNNFTGKTGRGRFLKRNTFDSDLTLGE